MLTYSFFEETQKYKKKCIFGAGKIGKQIGSIIHKSQEFIIDYYVDNKMEEGTEIISGIRCKKFDYLVSHHMETYVYICVGKGYKDEIILQLQTAGITNYCYLNESELFSVCESLGDADEYIKERYNFLLNDKDYISRQYEDITGRKLDWNCLCTFNEKLQWLKLYDRNPQYTKLVDKYAVKDYVKDRIGQQYVIDTLGVWENSADIDFGQLMGEYILKCTHDSGTAIIVKDFEQIDFEVLRQKIERNLQRNYFWESREWPYKNVPRRVMAEPLLKNDGEELRDYKVFCFSGEPRLIQVDIDRFSNHRRNVYDAEWNLLQLQIKYPTAHEVVIEKPECLEEMLSLAHILSEGMAHVRVDFYIVENKPIFGELTFYHGSGMEKILPEEWNNKMGDWIKLPEKYE